MVAHAGEEPPSKEEQKSLDGDDRERVKKQQHTARRYERLVEERGFPAANLWYEILFHDMKAARKETKVFVPLKFAPGEAVQIDGDEVTAYMNGEKIVVNLFCARLCHSCAPYAIAYRRQNLESFLDAIIHTFQYYGGVLHRRENALTALHMVTDIFTNVAFLLQQKGAYMRPFLL